MKRLLVTTFLFAVISCQRAHCDVIINITEDGADLLVTTSGSLNTIGLVNFSAGTNELQFQSNVNNIVAFGSGAQEFYSSGAASGITGVTRTGTLNNFAFVPPDVTLESGGADFGFRFFNDAIWIPEGYVSDSAVSQVLRVSTESFATAGLTAGDFSQFTWTGPGGGSGDTIRFQVSGSGAAVPEPSTFALLGLVAVGIGVRRCRRRKAA